MKKEEEKGIGKVEEEEDKKLRGIRTTRRYGSLHGPTSSSCGGLRPSAEDLFCPSGKKTNYYAF